MNRSLFSRCFSTTSRIVRAQAASASASVNAALSSTTITESSPSSAVESSCSEGTVLTGLNVFVGKQDPVALKDSEYPVWLWSLNEPIKKEFTEEEKLSKDYLKYLAEQRIKLNSMRRRMKK